MFYTAKYVFSFCDFDMTDQDINDRNALVQLLTVSNFFLSIIKFWFTRMYDIGVLVEKRTPTTLFFKTILEAFTTL